MTSQRFPGLLLCAAALGFTAWGLVLLNSPGGTFSIEWGQTIAAVVLLIVGLRAAVAPSPSRATAIRIIVSALGVFGALAIIGLTADNSSSRTWVRLGWAALVIGSVTAFLTWWAVPKFRRAAVVGGVVAAVVIASGAGLTFRCNKALERSWCDPLFEHEQALVEQVQVDGVLQRVGRAGGNTGAALRSYLINGSHISDVTTPPASFEYEEVPIRSIEVERGRYTAAEGPDVGCTIDVKLERVSAGNLETVEVSCNPS
jgi:hypothetical protein